MEAKKTGLGLCDIAFVMLLILKLTKLINCSWWWVFSPILIQIGIVVVVLICGLIKMLLDKLRYWMDH